MSFESVSQLKVSLRFADEADEADVLVGRLARRERKIYFEYDDDFIERGLSISPYKCPLERGVQVFDSQLFEGLAGVFNDSLPDGWGRLLLDRRMRAEGILPQQLSPLDRLTYVGAMGMGALVYEPDHTAAPADDKLDIPALAEQVEQILSGEASALLSELIALNGSSAGARPKAMIGLSADKHDVVYGTHRLAAADYQPWLVKFPNQSDGSDAGAIEYVYACMAAAAGLDVPEVHLFPAPKCSGYFAVRRFDRAGNRRLHMHTACGLLHSDFRTPSLDYSDLLRLTMGLTRDVREVERMYRLAVFNVLAHNRDDHAKNFSYLMNAAGEWSLSPPYDLTFSAGLNGEQSTMVLGEGKNPSVEDLARLGREHGLSKRTIAEIIEQTRAALSQWKHLAKTYGVSRANIALVASRIPS